MRALIAAVLLVCAAPALAQTSVDLGGLTADPSAPVEITADSLSVDREAGSALFSGNVVIGQGEMRIAAGEVRVTYNETSGDIRRLSASGGVTFVTGVEEAEAQTAEYDLDAGTLSLAGDVLLTQGPSALSADRMSVNLSTGAAQMEGRVRTVFARDGE